MKILIKTKVKCSLEKAKLKFDQELFEKLAPPLSQLNVKRFDGCKKGDEIHLTLKIAKIIQNDWVSLITADHSDDNEFYFIDEGLKLPLPLKNWKHIHRVAKLDDEHCLVIDDITYECNPPLLGKILYPTLYSLFAYRKPIYKRELV